MIFVSLYANFRGKTQEPRSRQLPSVRMKRWKIYERINTLLWSPSSATVLARVWITPCHRQPGSAYGHGRVISWTLMDELYTNGFLLGCFCSSIIRDVYQGRTQARILTFLYLLCRLSQIFMMTPFFLFPFTMLPAKALLVLGLLPACVVGQAMTTTAKCLSSYSWVRVLNQSVTPTLIPHS